MITDYKDKIKIVAGSHSRDKSDWLYNRFVSMSRKEDGTIDFENKLYLIVPEQDTNEKQRILMQKSKDYGYGILNIDVVSFDRIAHNVFDVLHIEPEDDKIIDDDAKAMILTYLLSKHKNDLTYCKKMIKNVGFAKKLTQVVSEFYSYDVTDKDIDGAIECCKDSPIVKEKLQDFKLLFNCFKENIKDKYSIKEDNPRTCVKYLSEDFWLRRLKEKIILR